MNTRAVLVLALLLAGCGSSSEGEHSATGVVDAFDPGKGTLLIAHSAIPSARIAAGTSEFELSDQDEAATLTKRQAIEFTFAVTPEGRRVIGEIRPAERRVATADR